MFDGKLNSEGFPEWTESGFRKAYENVPPDPETDMLYIVAGTQRQARQFARKHAIYPPKWRMVNNEKDLLGAVGNVVYVGSYYERQDLMKIKEMVSICIDAGHLKVVELDG